ncbi:MAG: sugar ABC transporter permease [Erysipelotrichaceae bacterium]|nr:sugar ABC transporter permease [Erysipelotrichaceae bacterium]MBQ1483191.1 sugar ABC transporter permease [Erysipelotrichaceae bacterium]
MAKGNEKKHRKSVSYAKWAYIFITPFFISYILFTLIPQFLTVYNSFFENYRNGLEQVGPNFVGLGNYIKLLTPDSSGTIDFLRYLGNSLAMWIAGAVPQFLIALLLAVLFTSSRLNLKGQGIAKTIIYMPNLIMASAFSMLVFSLFSNVGPVNKFLIDAGILKEYYNFFATKISVRTIIACMNFIMWFGNTTIVLMAGIMGIDQSLFESANLDGANSLHVFFDITLPLLMPILSYALITSMIGGIQMFDVPQVISNGKGTPNMTSTTVIMMLNNYLGISKNYGMSGALSVMLFIITGILGMLVYRSLARQYKD